MDLERTLLIERSELVESEEDEERDKASAA